MARGMPINEHKLLMPLQAVLLRMCNISRVSFCQPFMAVPHFKRSAHDDTYNVS